jgi:hypothetical protein
MLVHKFLPHEHAGLITLASLGFIALCLGIGIGASLMMPATEAAHEGEPA